MHRVESVLLVAREVRVVLAEQLVAQEVRVAHQELVVKQMQEDSLVSLT